MHRTIVVPAVFIGCMIVIWIGTVAAANMPSEELLAPTQTAIASATQDSKRADQAAVGSADQISADQSADSCTLPASYPQGVLQWCTLIQTAAEQAGLPANLIAAVILQESGGDSLAYSSSGAVGLMQVMPRDGLAAEFMCVNGPCFAGRPTIQELQEPAFNIQFGSHMLADLIEKHGSFRDALYRYGPMDVGYSYADRVLAIYQTY